LEKRRKVIVTNRAIFPSFAALSACLATLFFGSGRTIEEVNKLNDLPNWRKLVCSVTLEAHLENASFGNIHQTRGYSKKGFIESFARLSDLILSFHHLLVL
jgi:hypothetical protein